MVELVAGLVVRRLDQLIGEGDQTKLAVRFGRVHHPTDGYVVGVVDQCKLLTVVGIELAFGTLLKCGTAQKIDSAIIRKMVADMADSDIVGFGQQPSQGIGWRSNEDDVHIEAAVELHQWFAYQCGRYAIVYLMIVVLLAAALDG